MEITSQLVLECHSFAELTRRLGKSPHSSINRKLKEKLLNLKIPFDHFTANGVVAKQKVEKTCPICKKIFILPVKDQITCSYSCSNTYFARKRNVPEKYKNYKTICWYNHDKKCVVCGEDKIVAVHHMDENNKNNDPKNLVPLCPTHHGYWHSKYRELIRDKVETYIKTNIL